MKINKTTKILVAAVFVSLLSLTIIVALITSAPSTTNDNIGSMPRLPVSRPVSSPAADKLVSQQFLQPLAPAGSEKSYMIELELKQVIVLAQSNSKLEATTIDAVIEIRPAAEEYPLFYEVYPTSAVEITNLQSKGSQTTGKVYRLVTEGSNSSEYFYTSDLNAITSSDTNYKASSGQNLTLMSNGKSVLLFVGCKPLSTLGLAACDTAIASLKVRI